MMEWILPQQGYPKHKGRSKKQYLVQWDETVPEKYKYEICHWDGDKFINQFGGSPPVKRYALIQ